MHNQEVTIEELLQLKFGLETVTKAVVENPLQEYNMVSFTDCIIGRNFGYWFNGQTKHLFGRAFFTDASSWEFKNRPMIVCEVNRLFACHVRASYKQSEFFAEEWVSKDDWLAEAGLVMLKLDQAIEAKRHVEEI